MNAPHPAPRPHAAWLTLGLLVAAATVSAQTPAGPASAASPAPAASVPAAPAAPVAPSAPAVVADSSDGGGPGGGTFFMVLTANGNPVGETAWTASARASFGRGAYMVIRGAERPLPAGRVALQLHGYQGHVAPISTIFTALFRGGSPEVKGTVTVDLQPGQRYRVNGVMDVLRREVWLEDARGQRVEGSTVTAAADPEVLKQMEGSVFTTHTLRYEGDWINEAGSPELPIVPVGSRIKVLDYGRHRANVLIDGRKMRIGVDYTREKETIQQFIARVTSAEDPRPALGSQPERMRNAIRAGRVLPGMTRQQVAQALGRPRVDYNPSLDDREWRYDVSGQGEAYVVFDDAGLLKAVDASRGARQVMLYEGS